MTELRYQDLRRLVDRVAEGRRLLIASDFDGTLAPIVPHPAGARIPQETLETLQRLAESGSVVVAIVSGRQLSDLACRVDVPCILSGNHGLEIAGQGLQFVHPVAAERAALIADAATLLADTVTSWPGAWVEDKGLTATVHFRKVESAHRNSVVLAVRRAMARFSASLGLRAGKCSLELHPRIEWNKGKAVEYIRAELGLEDSPVLCLGDDTTDETMFRVLAGHVTVRVGTSVRTSAAFCVPDTHAAGVVLRTVCELFAGSPEAELQTSA